MTVGTKKQEISENVEHIVVNSDTSIVYFICV